MALVGGADEETLSLAPDNLRLLIIDASASSRTALCALLKQCSYEVRTLGQLRTFARALEAWHGIERAWMHRSRLCQRPPRLCIC